MVVPIQKWKKNEEKRKWVRKQKSMKDTRNGRTKEVDVLDLMSVTAAVFHLERSALNADALENAVKVLSMPWWCQSKIRSGRRTKKIEMGEKTEVDERHKEWKNQRTSVDVL